MKIPFKEDFEGLPEPVANSLIEQLEDSLGVLRNRYWGAMSKDRRNLSAEQISAKIYTIFETAERIKKDLA